jgi:hypothetical protein
MTNTKRHLLKAGGREPITACGVRNPRLFTQNPAYVTCRACRRTVFMADAEIRSRTRKRRSNP